MHFVYKDAAAGGHFELFTEDAALARAYFDERGHNVNTIAWNRGPAQTLTVDGVERSLPADGIVTLTLNQTYRFERAVDIVAWRFNREFYCIVDHDAEVSCAGFLFYGLPSPMVLEPEEALNRKLSLLLPVFEDEFATHDNIQGEMLRMLLKRLIILLTREGKRQHLPDDTPEREYDLVREFNLLVELNFRTHHQVADYAKLLHKSPKTLSNYFARVGDRSPLEIIRERIALEGKRLLLYTDLQVAEIADELGFREAAHFSRFFKSVTGMAPTGVRG